MATNASISIDTTGFDERTLLLLGALMMESQHGYQINDFIENRLCSVITMKKPTAYALLDRLANHEAVDVQIVQESARPARKVYEITDRGRALFMELLRQNLAESDLPRFAGDIGLMFMNYLEPAEVLLYLRERLRGVEESLAAHIDVPSHGPKLRLDLAIDHARAMREAERDWLMRTIEELSYSKS